MTNEINWAIENNQLYYSKRFLENMREKWQSLFIEAAKSHAEHWLAFQIEDNLMLKGFEIAKKPKGGYTTKHVPETASETLSSGQFNRYYIIGLCQRALAEGNKFVEIYRAKESTNSRFESESLVGKKIDATKLITELRNLESSLRSDLLKPNSGLSVRLIA